MNNLFYSQIQGFQPFTKCLWIATLMSTQNLYWIKYELINEIFVFKAHSEYNQNVQNTFLSRLAQYKNLFLVVFRLISSPSLKKWRFKDYSWTPSWKKILGASSPNTQVEILITRRMKLCAFAEYGKLWKSLIAEYTKLNVIHTYWEYADWNVKNVIKTPLKLSWWELYMWTSPMSPLSFVIKWL